MISLNRAFAPALALALLVGAAPALAQTDTAAGPTGLWLTTPHPEFSAPLGEDISIPLSLRNDNLPPQRAEFSVSGLPASWSWALKGDGHEVAAAMVLPGDSSAMTLELTPPDGVATDTYAFTVRASYQGGTATLPISLMLVEPPAAEVTLDPELPALRGTPKSTFQFKVKVTNNSSNDGLFNLAADAGQGFSVTFKRGFGNEEITGVPIAAGKAETVTIEIKPTTDIAAGQYPVRFAVLSGDLQAQTVLGMDITGVPDLTLTGPQERLSGEATAGRPESFDFTVTNNGGADAVQVQMSASSPQGWTIDFDPKSVDVLGAGQTQAVTVTITPTERAIAGDYVTTIRANATGNSTSAQFRVTVNTSTWWGIVGLAVIAAAVLVLVIAVMRYGRR